MSDVQITAPGAEGDIEFQGLRIDEVFADQEIKATCVDYIIGELAQMRTDLESQGEKWKEWRRQREMRPKEKVRNYPWKNAANVTVGLATSNTNAIFAALKNKFSVRKPFFMLRAADSTLAASAIAMERFINRLVESKHHIDLRKKNLTILYEVASMGTEFVKIPWVTKKWQFRRQGQLVDKVIYSGPQVIPLQIDDVLCKQHIENLQETPVIGVVTRYQKYELVQLERNGWFENTELVFGSPETALQDRAQETLDRNEAKSTLTSDSPEFEIVEGFAFYDIDGSGIPIDIKFFIHEATKTLLRIEFNELGQRDIVRIPYIEMPFSVYGMGVGWLVQYLQEEIDTLHNTRLNSQHLAAYNIIVTKNGMDSLSEVELSPLCEIKAEMPKEDFVQLKFPDVSQSTFMAEQLATQYADRVTGAGNAMMGQPDDFAKTRATASGTMFLAQQGGKLFEAASKNIEEAYAEIGLFILYQLVFHSDLTKASLLPMMSMEDQLLITPILDMNVEDIPSRFNVSVKVTDIDQTEDAKLQKAMTMMQLQDLYTDRTLAMAEKIFMLQQQAPQLVEPALKLYVARTKLMEEMYELLKVTDPESFTVYIKDIEVMLGQQEMQKDLQVAEVKKNEQQQQNANSVQSGYSGGAGGLYGGHSPAPGVPSAEAPPAGGEGEGYA